MIKLKIEYEDPANFGPHVEGHSTVIRMTEVFERCLNLQIRKGRLYGQTWREQGYMGNVARVLGKVSRLRNMVWRDIHLTDAEETAEDTLGDLINLSAFALINMEEENRWG